MDIELAFYSGQDEDKRQNIVDIINKNLIKNGKYLTQSLKYSASE